MYVGDRSLKMSMRLSSCLAFNILNRYKVPPKLTRIISSREVSNTSVLPSAPNQHKVGSGGMLIALGLGVGGKYIYDEYSLYYSKITDLEGGVLQRIRDQGLYPCGFSSIDEPIKRDRLLFLGDLQTALKYRTNKPNSQTYVVYCNRKINTDELATYLPGANIMKKKGGEVGFVNTSTKVLCLNPENKSRSNIKFYFERLDVDRVNTLPVIKIGLRGIPVSNYTDYKKKFDYQLGDVPF